MADNDDAIDGSTPDDVLDAARFDSEQFDEVAAALADLSFLDPRTEPTEPMPDWAWDRLTMAIATEASLRAADQHENVVAFPAAASTTVVPAAPADKGEPHRFRWMGGLVAASVAILAITVGVRVTGGTSSGDIVAAESPVSVSAAAAPLGAPPASATAFSAEGAGGQDSLAVAAAPSAVAKAVTPNPAQPAKMVVESNTQYTEAGLTGQVKTLLDKLGVHSAREARTMPAQPVQMPVDDGFTSSWSALRDCLAWLVQSPRAQALVVDRATFEGADAGVIVVPASDVDASVSPPPTATIESSMGTMDVWVVNPACRHQVDSIMEHLPLVWAP